MKDDAERARATVELARQMGCEPHEVWGRFGTGTGNAVMQAMIAFAQQPEGSTVTVPIEQLREWYTQAFVIWCLGADDDDERPTPAFMLEMEAMLPPLTAMLDVAPIGEE